jgi:hypothetical protein
MFDHAAAAPARNNGGHGTTRESDRSLTKIKESQQKIKIIFTN